MGASQVDICNEALIRLGAPTITDIDDNTKAAKLCKKLYERVVQQTSAEGPWANTVKRVALAQLATDPAFGYNAAFQLPGDLLKVIDINDTCPGERDYRVENDQLYIDDSAVSISYIADLGKTGDFGIYLENSIIDLLAAKLAYAFTGSMTIAAEMMNMYKQNLSSNLAADNQQGSKDRVMVRDYIDVR